MARLLQFFQLLLAELGVARQRGRGWSVGVVLLVLVLGEVSAYVRSIIAILDAGEDVEVLERLAVGVVAVHVECPSFGGGIPLEKESGPRRRAGEMPSCITASYSGGDGVNLDMPGT
jgi:hypothetical protein